MTGAGELERLAERVHPVAMRLLDRLGDRWIKGTGICHRSVGTELIELGLAESRIRRNAREIRVMPLGIVLRDFLRARAQQVRA